MAVHVYIDGSKGGLPDAPVYYATFPHEPSRLAADDMTLDPAFTTVAKKPSAEGMLDVMIKAGSEGVVMVVCHAWSNGLHLPMLGGDTTYLTADTMDSLDKVMKLEADAAKVRAMPEGTDDEKKAKVEAWRQLIGSVDATLVEKPFTLPQAEKLYQRLFDKWAVGGLQLQAAGGAAALRRLLGKVKAVRDLKLARVEFRACRLGDKDLNTMKKVKAFFACRRLLAPEVETFFLGPIVVLTVGRMAAELQRPKGRDGLRRFTSAVRTRGGRQGSGRLPGPAGTDVVDRARALEIIDKETTRSFIVFVHVMSYKTAIDADTGFTYYRPGPIRAVPEFFHLTVNEITRFHYQGFACASPAAGEPDKPNKEILQKFLQKYVMPGVVVPAGGFPVAGFWIGSQPTPFILPNEPEYRAHIKEV